MDLATDMAAMVDMVSESTADMATAGMGYMDMVDTDLEAMADTAMVGTDVAAMVDTATEDTVTASEDMALDTAGMAMAVTAITESTMAST